MKNKILMIAGFLIVLTSCSKSENPIIPIDPPPVVVTPPAPTVGDDIVTTFAPNVVAHAWTFSSETVVSTPTGTAPTTAIDVLKVDSDFVENAITYKIMKTTPTNPAGFYCNMVNNNKLRIDGSSVKMTGEFKFNLGPNVLKFPVTDFVIFKENAVAGTNLGPVATGSRILDIPTIATFNPLVNYSIRAVAGGNSPTITYNSITYSDIKKVIIYITINANATFPSPIGLTQILEPLSQDVIISTQYYSKNVGLVKAETKIEYHLNQAITAGAPSIPKDGLQNVTDNLSNKNF